MVFVIPLVCVSNGDNLVPACGVTLSIFINSTTSDASLHGVFFGSLLIKLTSDLRVCIRCSTSPYALSMMIPMIVY